MIATAVASRPTSLQKLSAGRHVKLPAKPLDIKRAWEMNVDERRKVYDVVDQVGVESYVQY